MQAPHVCNTVNCSVLVYGSKRRCATHDQPWGGKGGTSRRTGTSAHKQRRLRVLGRAGYRCAECGGAATHLDHITALSEGGADTDLNSQALCATCHQRKSSIEGRRAQM